ncbi:MAG: IclR family transcriptional regulator [Jatrophihabitans sp.]|uniref:IclR family transcriptional regulator n=1 Tax=Jatrophihabitans sp. TaxID=1932789 RepID=UPI003F7D2D28
MATVPAAQQALRILQHLSHQAAPVPASSIARDLRLPRSTTYHLLDTLVGAGFVTHLADQRRYGLGLAAYELGTGYSRQAPLQRLARLPLSALVDRTGHTGHLAVLHGPEVVYVLEERARGRAPLITDVGVRLPAHLTASGRAILAALPAAQVRALFADPEAFVQRHGAGPTSLSALRPVLAAGRRRGWADEDGTVTPGFASVGVAVLDHNDYPVASVALTFASVEVPEAARAALAEQVTRTARTIASRLGGHRG